MSNTDFHSGRGYNIQDILEQALARGNETSGTEFKKYIDPNDDKTWYWLLRAIAAMANGSTPGYIIVGIDDTTHEIFGVSDDLWDKFDTTKISTKVGAYLSPLPTIEVHRTNYEGKNIVVIVVDPFMSVPVFVANTFENYGAGTILIRTPEGQTAPARRESDIRALCERIVARHRDSIAGYLRRYFDSDGKPIDNSAFRHDTHEDRALEEARALASAYWPVNNKYIEVFFAPCSNVALDLPAFRACFPWAVVPFSRHGFPTTEVFDWPGPQLKAQGWISTVPYKHQPDSPELPLYLWAMSLSWSFLDRDRFWEDDGAPRIVGGIGLMHLATRVCLLLRLLRRVGRRYAFSPNMKFAVGTRLKGVKDRYLASEHTQDTSRIPRSEFDDVEIRRVIFLSELEPVNGSSDRFPAVALSILEEAAWKLGRTDLPPGVFSRVINETAQRVDPAVLFPLVEDVPIYIPEPTPS